MKRETWLAAVIVCGAVIALGAFLPWQSVGILALSGMSGDGVFAIGIGAAMIVAGVAGYSSGGWRAGAPVALLGVLAAGLAVFEYVSLKTYAPPGTGLLTIGFAGLAAVLVLSLSPPKPATPQA